MKSFAPKITHKMICKICGGKKEYFIHDAKSKSYSHNYQPRLETEVEAAYRTGYSEGYSKAADKAVWGPGWD
jgi:hypothetical protein